MEFCFFNQNSSNKNSPDFDTIEIGAAIFIKNRKLFP